jgi:hypothetical protein
MLVIGRVLDVLASEGKGALSYWQGQYIPLDRDKAAPDFVETGVPTARALSGV